MYRKAIFAARELETPMNRIDADQKHSITYSISTDGDLVRVRLIRNGIEMCRTHSPDWTSALSIARAMLNAAIAILEVVHHPEPETVPMHCLVCASEDALHCR